MDIRGLLTAKRAVSPVVGVALLLAVMVLLVAIVGAFVTGFADRGSPPPQVAFEYEYDYGENLTIQVAGGDSFESGRVTVDSFNSSNVVFQGTALGRDTAATWTETDEALSAPRQVTSGDQVTLDDIQDPQFELDIVWRSESGDRGAIIGTAEGPVP
jgi:FlaG/FlaF family flagellin (archaellin)